MIFFVILIIVSLFLFGFGGAAFAFGLIAIAAFVMAGIKLRKGWQVVTEQDRKAGLDPNRPLSDAERREMRAVSMALRRR
jgi:hypothetical protein